MKQVFLSYAREDSRFVEELEGRLSAAGLDVWQDATDLAAGDEWRAGIDAALDSCDVVLVVVSSAAMGSHFVTYEWARAMGASKPLLPILVGDAVLHPRLESIQHLDFREDRPWARLIASIVSFRDQEPAIPATIENTRKGLDDPDLGTQLEALRRLAKLRHPAALAFVIGALDHPSTPVCREAANLLADRDEEEAVLALVTAAEHSDSPVRDHAIWALSGRPRSKFITDMLVGFFGDPADVRKVAAIRAMGHAASDDHLALLVEAAGDPSPQVRRYVWEALASYGQRALPDLLTLADESTDPDTKYTLVKAFHEIADPAAIPFLAAQLSEETPTGDGVFQPSEYGFSRPSGRRPLADHARMALEAIGTPLALDWLKD